MSLYDGSRGSKMPFSTVIRQGYGMRSASVQSGRSTVREIASRATASIDFTLTTCGMPIHSAISAPTCAVSPSVVCFPQTIRS